MPQGSREGKPGPRDRFRQRRQARRERRAERAYLGRQNQVPRSGQEYAKTKDPFAGGNG
jgi:hypothetical protein